MLIVVDTIVPTRIRYKKALAERRAILKFAVKWSFACELANEVTYLHYFPTSSNFIVEFCLKPSQNSDILALLDLILCANCDFSCLGVTEK